MRVQRQLVHFGNKSQTSKKLSCPVHRSWQQEQQQDIFNLWNCDHFSPTLYQPKGDRKGFLCVKCRLLRYDRSAMAQMIRQGTPKAMILLSVLGCLYFSHGFMGWMPIWHETNHCRMVWFATKQSVHGEKRPKTSASSCICQAFGTGTGGHPSVLKPDKSSQGASRSMAKASSEYILGMGTPLHQFWNPKKPARAPAAAWQKPAPTTFWAFGIGTGGHPFWNPIKPARAPAAAWLKPAPRAWGSLWDRDRGPSVSFETR